MIQVSQIYNECLNMLGISDSPTAYLKISQAIRLLGAKASMNPETAWNPLLVYVNLPVSDDYYVALPTHIEAPVSITINGNPSFPRGKLFEYVQNGPGPQETLAGWQWVDQGNKPIQHLLPSLPTLIKLTSDNPSGTSPNPTPDNTQSCILKVIMQDATEQTLTLPINGTLSAQGIIDIAYVSKPVTNGNITLSDTLGNVYAVWKPNDVVPDHIWIKLSQKASVVRMLAKRKTWAVTQQTDIIPLDSPDAIIYMVKAVKYYDEDNIPVAQAAEELALKFLETEQSSRLLFQKVSQTTGIGSILNLNINNRDSVIVGDIYDDADKIFGPIGQQKLFDRITTAIELLANRTHWDPLLGYCDIQVNQEGQNSNWYATMPRFVETIVDLSADGQRGSFRNRWFEFNLNGLGEFHQCKGPAGQVRNNRPHYGWEWGGEVCIARDPDVWYPAYNQAKQGVFLVAVPQMAQDNESPFRIFGYDQNNNTIYDPVDGQEGVNIYCSTSSKAYPAGQLPFFTINRIQRGATSGFVALWVTDGTNLIEQIGFYAPDETEPLYHRIRFSNCVHRIRIAYRKRWKRVNSLLEPIHLRSRLAIIQAMIAINLMEQPGVDVAAINAAKQVATEHLEEEWKANNPQEVRLDIQFDRRTYGPAFRTWTM